MEDRNIKIKSTVKGVVNLYEPYSRLDMSWSKKNAKKTVSLAKLSEAIWTEGVSNLFKDGYLVIDEPDAFELMKKLGLEEDDATEPQNVIVLTDAQRKRLLTTAPLAEFKQTFETLNYEQRQLLADFAIENKYVDFDKCEVVRKAIGTDIINAVKLQSLPEEGDKKIN